jgi:hypothetical protein
MILLITIIIISILLVLIVSGMWFRSPKYNANNIQVTSTDRNFRVVFSMTTTPPRLPFLKETLKDLMLSSINPDHIYLNIPYKNKRLKSTYVLSDEIIEFVSEHDYITINRCEDVGPATKLLPTLKKEQDPETIIITADDDIFYPETYHEELLHEILSSTKTAFAYRGIIFDKNNDSPIYVTKTKECDVLEGFTGVVYKRKFFTDDIFDICKECYFTDDIWISAHLATNNIKRVLLDSEPHNVAMGRKGMPITQRKNNILSPLHEKNHKVRNKECYKKIKSFF